MLAGHLLYDVITTQLVTCQLTSLVPGSSQCHKSNMNKQLNKLKPSLNFHFIKNIFHKSFNFVNLAALNSITNGTMHQKKTIRNRKNWIHEIIKINHESFFLKRNLRWKDFMLSSINGTRIDGERCWIPLGWRMLKILRSNFQDSSQRYSHVLLWQSLPRKQQTNKRIMDNFNEHHQMRRDWHWQCRFCYFTLVFRFF